MLKKNNSKKISFVNLNFIQRIFDTVNASLLVLIFIFSFLSFNSQRRWSKTYKILSRVKANNNNLIDYISQTEEFYISSLDSLNNFRKATPRDLIYLEKIKFKKDNYFKNKIVKIISGIKDSKYHRGY